MDEESAARIRQILDGEEIMGVAVKVYFGQPTPIEPRDEHLHLPDAGKLFFISPPPSPPHGWEVKLEGAPNKQVHAEDLAEALANLHQRARENIQAQATTPPRKGATRHGRSGSTTIYNPQEHGLSPDLPAIEVEDLSGDSDVSPIEEQRALFAHTSRPPVELMQE